MNTTGTTSRLSTVEVIKPPMTAIAIGERKLGSAPKPQASGNMPAPIAMGAGMLPLACGFGADPSFRSPMAIAVIGGLITSTVLSLLVVPVVFTYIDDLEGWIKRLMRRLRGASAPHPSTSVHNDQPEPATMSADN